MNQAKPDTLDNYSATDGSTETQRGQENSSSSASSAFSTALEPERGWQRVDLKELWRYRELLWFMAMRDVQVRYKQTVLGAAWAIIQPVMSMIVFSIFFGKFGKIPSDGLPYPVFAYTALLPWQLFANTLGQASNSLISNTNLLTKVYFPRLIIPLSAALSGLVDFCIAFVVLLGLMAYFHIVPGWGIVFLPLLLLFAITAALAIGFWLCALNVQYRDVRYVVPFLTQLWMFATPVAYPASMVPEKYRLFYALNPMTGVVEGFRWALLGGKGISLPIMGMSLLATLLLLVGGLFYFRRFEASFADLA
ncbi:ABC transporter permease [bacterium]|nr:MAG: ABC transporter permease [bacterium]